jgi:hypothetical protein
MRASCTSFRWTIIFTLAAACSVAAQPVPPANPPTPPAPAVRVEDALQNITNLVRPGRVGYATIWDGNKYVQCRRQTGRGMRCEAAGMTMQPSLRTVLTGERLNRLTTLGWSLDASFGNYVRTFPAEMPAARIAEQIVRVLSEAYDATATELEIKTAWVADIPCPPRNGPTQNLAGIINDAPAMLPTAVLTCSYHPPPETTQKVTSAAELVALHGARVTAEVQRLRINANASEPPFTIFDVSIGYIQCMPETPAPALYCEAQSEESWPALTAILTPERVARLHAAGYADPGRAPNYSKSYPFAAYSDAATANEILTLLFEIYGYNGAQQMKIDGR